MLFGIFIGVLLKYAFGSAAEGIYIRKDQSPGVQGLHAEYLSLWQRVMDSTLDSSKAELFPHALPEAVSPSYVLFFYC